MFPAYSENYSPDLVGFGGYNQSKRIDSIDQVFSSVSKSQLDFNFFKADPSFHSFTLFFTGHRSLYQEGIRQEI
jgi:hypothetical protein